MLFFKTKSKLDLDILQKEFKKQTDTLIKKGYPALFNATPESFREKLDILWNSLAPKISDIEIKQKGNIPLLIVPQQAQPIEMIRKMNGTTDLNLDNAKNHSQTPPNLFYFILDVEDGKRMIAKSPQESLRRFKKENRLPLTLEESIAFLTHYPETLKDHYLVAGGTFYTKENEEMPFLWTLDDEDRPQLHYAWFDIAHGHYGTASCAMKI